MLLLLRGLVLEVLGRQAGSLPGLFLYGSAMDEADAAGASGVHAQIRTSEGAADVPALSATLWGAGTSEAQTNLCERDGGMMRRAAA